MIFQIPYVSLPVFDPVRRKINSKLTSFRKSAVTEMQVSPFGGLNNNRSFEDTGSNFCLLRIRAVVSGGMFIRFPQIPPKTMPFMNQG